MKIYLVGGAVRDELLGLPVKERDWAVVGSTEAEMLALGFKKVGKDFPVFLHPDTHEEYALARTERKTGKGYYGFTCDSSPLVTIEEELLRRDLTINAIAKTETGLIIDPFNGRQDLAHRILRHVSPAFAEDPVRILRVARFAARFEPLGFTVAPETLALMKTMVANGEIDALVPERVWKELQRALTEQKPTAFIQVMRDCGALSKIFPALDKLWGIPQRSQYHPETDTGMHVMLAMGMICQLTTDPKIRFAVLCHDLGKGISPPEQLPSHKGHEAAGVKLIKDWCAQYRVPNDYRDLALIVAEWHLHSHRAFELKASTLVEMLYKMDALRKPQRFLDFLLATEADSRGRLGLEKNMYPQAQFLRQVLTTVQSISVQPLLDQGLTGEELNNKLFQARVAAVQKLNHKA